MLDQFVAWLKDWQTLVAGGLAIVAAFIGGHFIMVQVRLAERQENDRRARAYAAARATMPLALSSISEYALACGRTLRVLHMQAAEETIPHQTAAVQFPTLPVEVISDFQNLIATTVDPAVGEVFARLLASLQVQAARLRSVQSNLAPDAPSAVMVVSAELEDRILDAAGLFARAGALFEFARGLSDVPPLEFKPGDRKLAMHLMGFYDYEQARLYETADRRSDFSI